METDFSQVTPCGGSCTGCEHYVYKKCEGCLVTKGVCLKLGLDHVCRVYKCCDDRNIKFCGLCEEYPCEFMEKKITAWDPNAIERGKILAAEYKSMVLHNNDQ